MFKIITRKIDMEDSLKQRIDLICEFCHTTPKYINGSIRKIDKTNLSYLEPHRIIIKGKTFLAFNYSKTLYLGNLFNKIEIKDLEAFIKKFV